MTWAFQPNIRKYNFSWQYSRVSFAFIKFTMINGLWDLKIFHHESPVSWLVHLFHFGIHLFLFIRRVVCKHKHELLRNKLSFLSHLKLPITASTRFFLSQVLNTAASSINTVYEIFSSCSVFIYSEQSIDPIHSILLPSNRIYGCPKNLLQMMRI